MPVGENGTMDVLAEVLRVSGARGALGVVLKAGGTWGLWLDPSPGAALHVVSRGTAWLHVPGRKPLEMRAGDAALLSPGTAHGIASGSSTTMGPCDRKATNQALAEAAPCTWARPRRRRKYSSCATSRTRR